MTSDHEQISRWQGDLLPHMVDRLARGKPDGVYGMWPVAAASYEAGFRTVTYAQFANVVNGLAWWITDQLGPGWDNEVIAYLGPNDLRLTALVLSAVKAGYTLFLTSPRNSPAAHRSLLDSLNCRTLVTTDPTPPPAQTLLEAANPRKLTVPSIEELLEKNYKHFSFDKTFEDARWEPLLVLHTSGSTGLPKPLVWTHETGARHHNCTGHSTPDGIPSLDGSYLGKRVLVTVPPFHGAGLGQYLLYAIPFGNIVVAPAAGAIVTAQGLVEALKQTPADVAILVPSVVAELAEDPELLEYCASHLELILYIGGDLPQTIGDRVAGKVKLRCQWGATEVGIPQQLLPPELGPSEWRFIQFHPCLGAAFEEITEGVYELVVRRDEGLAKTQMTFSIRGFEKLEPVYRTRDLFERHSTVPNAWCWRARADDIIVFLNGEKTNPVSMEQHIMSRNPELAGALVIGAQRFQAALLIEPTSTCPLDTNQQAALIQRVWPSIEEANKVAPAHARVEKGFVLVTTPDKPLIRAGKGTIQRMASLTQYAAEIDKLYENTEADLDEDNKMGVLVDATDAASISALIRDTIRTIADLSIDDTTSFFDVGIDSLQALQLTRALRRGLHRADLALPTIYQNPTVPQLAAAVLQQDGRIDDRELMEPLLSTYQGLIRQIPKPDAFSAPAEGTIDVILTGSTGSLGTYFLRALLDRPGVGHIFCLNRSKDGGRAAQLDRYRIGQLPVDDLESRVTFLRANMAQPCLGLDDATYEMLRARASLIIHNAWPVNFNLGLSAFRPQLAGVVNLFAFAAAAAPRKMRVLFISSIGAVAGGVSDDGSKDPVAEVIYESLEAPYANGYARSKLMSELLCETAAHHVGIPVAIARVGQVAGPARQPGLWNRAEWLPSLVISSLHLRCLPDSLGPKFSEVDWVPSDLLANVVVDLATLSKPSTTSEVSSGAEVFNLRNPRTIMWDALLPAFREAARAHVQQEIEVVSPSRWLTRLQESIDALSEGDAQDLVAAAAFNPAIKLLDFYRDGLWTSDAASQAMSVDRALAASPSLRDLPPVGPRWIQKWVGEWVSRFTEPT